LEQGNKIQTGPRWKRFAIVSSVCLLVGTAVFAVLLGTREPKYKGKSLSAWVDSYVTPTNHWERVEAVSAIQTIGPKALPWLLGWSRYQTPVWQVKFAERCKRFGFDWPTRFVNERNRRRDLIWPALAILGPRADPAIPEIGRIALTSSFQAESAMAFLSERPEGVPALLRVIAEGKREHRVRAMHYLGRMPNLGTNGTAAVALLLKCLNEDDEVIAASAARSLGAVALETKAVVPALLPHLRDPRRDVRDATSSALGNLANHPAALPDLLAALPEFVAAQQSTDYTVRAWAKNVIWKIAPDVLTNQVKDF
jgi:hypothetical protein